MIDQAVARLGLGRWVGTLVRYSSASILYQGVRMLANIAILRWLLPETIGLWQSLLLIGTYAAIVQGGAIHGLNRELPFCMGQNDTGAVAELAGTARVIAFIGAGLCMLGIPIAWFVFDAGAERWGTAAVLVGAAATMYRLYLTATYRAAQAFEALAKIHLAEAALTALTLYLVYWLGYAGLAIRFVALACIGTGLNHVFRPLKNVGRFRWARLRELFATGIPIFLFGYLSDVARSFPRLIMLWFGGVLWVGLFAPASAVMGALQMIPGSVATYVYPQMSHRFGRTGDPSSLWPIARATAFWSVLIGVPCAGALAIAVPWLIHQFFPEYVESIPAVQWTVIAGVFMGASVAVNALASLKAYRWMFTFVGARLALLFALPWWGGQMTGNLAGVAAGMSAAYALDFVIVVSLVRVATKPLPRAEAAL